MIQSQILVASSYFERRNRVLFLRKLSCGSCKVLSNTNNGNTGEFIRDAKCDAWKAADLKFNLTEWQVTVC